MKKVLIAVSILIMLCSQAFAHSGRTDSKGGHNCSQKSKDKGLCTGYHYHSNGSIHLDIDDTLVSFTDIEGVEVKDSIHDHSDDSHIHDDQSSDDDSHSHSKSNS